jgi:hypothetical protein
MLAHHSVPADPNKTPTKVAVDAAAAIGYPAGSRVLNVRRVEDTVTFDVERPEEKTWPPKLEAKDA